MGNVRSSMLHVTFEIKFNDMLNILHFDCCLFVCPFFFLFFFISPKKA